MPRVVKPLESFEVQELAGPPFLSWASMRASLDAIGLVAFILPVFQLLLLALIWWTLAALGFPIRRDSPVPWYELVMGSVLMGVIIYFVVMAICVVIGGMLLLALRTCRIEPSPAGFSGFVGGMAGYVLFVAPWWGNLYSRTFASELMDSELLRLALLPGLAIVIFQYVGAASQWRRETNTAPRWRWNLLQMLTAITWGSVLLGLLKAFGFDHPRVLAYIFGGIAAQLCTLWGVMAVLSWKESPAANS
jgi:hypothetical protein